MAIRKFNTENRENDSEFKSLEIDSKMYSNLKWVIYIVALLNYKNTNMCGVLFVITSLFNIIERVQKNKLEGDIKNIKFNTRLIILNCIVIVFVGIDLFLYNVIK